MVVNLTQLQVLLLLYTISLKSLQIELPHYYYYYYCLFRAAPTAYGGSQARGLIGAIAVGLHHSRSNTRSKLCLRPTPQLTATSDP